jgi:hypothetical protein
VTEKPRVITHLADFPESLRAKYESLESDITYDYLTPTERQFLESQIAEAKERKKKLG